MGDFLLSLSSPGLVSFRSFVPILVLSVFRLLYVLKFFYLLDEIKLV